MTKPRAKIDTRNPFIPSLSRFCLAAEYWLVGSTGVLVLAAGVIAFVRQIAGAP